MSSVTFSTSVSTNGRRAFRIKSTINFAVAAKTDWPGCGASAQDMFSQHGLRVIGFRAQTLRALILYPDQGSKT